MKGTNGKHQIEGLKEATQFNLRQNINTPTTKYLKAFLKKLLHNA